MRSWFDKARVQLGGKIAQNASCVFLAKRCLPSCRLVTLSSLHVF